MPKLPNNPSELIAVALKDLRVVERSKKYKVNMTLWHSPAQDNNMYLSLEEPCSVCFAGAVMATSLNSAREEQLTPSHFDEDTCRKLEALDEFREGQISQAFDTMRISANDSRFRKIQGNKMFDIGPCNLKNRDTTPYSRNPAKFKRQMTKLAKDLAKIGF